MDILQDYPQVEFMLALHEGVAVCMADAYARLTQRPSFVELHIAPGLGNALGHDAQRAHRQDPDGGLRRPVAEQRAAPGAAPLRAAGRHGEADRQVVVSGRARPRRAARACGGRSRSPPSRLRARSSWRCRWTSWTHEAEIDIAPTTYINWRTRPDAGRPARELADLLAKAKRPMLMVGDSRQRWPTPRPRSTARGRAARRADLRVLRLRVQRLRRATR